MAIKFGTEYLTNGNGICDFGTVGVYNSMPVTFTIENTGAASLSISSISCYSGETSQFLIVASSMSSKITGGSSTTFKIKFKPTSVGYKTATIMLVSNSSNGKTFTFTVEGFGKSTVTEPDITIKQGSSDLPDGSGIFDFGNIGADSSSSPVTFTISNNGNSDLSVTNVSFYSGDTDQFTITAPSIPCSLVPSESTTFTITFSPTLSGNKSAVVRIMNDDPYESPYYFTATGYGEPLPEPEIDVRQGAIYLTNGTSIYNFGTIYEGNSSSPATFTIENNGTGDLIINSVSLTAGDITEFGIDDSSIPATLSPGSSTSFDITFSPASTGYKIADVSIDNDDSDEGPFVFQVDGDGAPQPEPDINVKQGLGDLPDGTGLFNFGHVLISNSSPPVTFTIENTGTGDLNIAGVSFASGDMDQFSIDDSLMAPTVTPGSNTTFDITFSPTSAGYKTAVVSIDNDDPDESPYIFTVEGDSDLTAVPDISLPDVEGSGSYDFGSKLVGESDFKEFTIKNEGTGNLNITSVSLTSGDTSQFSIDTSTMSSIVAPGTDTKFKITFLPTITGNILATVSIDNNDPDEDPYIFTVEGYGDPAPIADINIKQGGANYPDGSTYDFGGGGGSRTRTFTIENNGTDDLVIINILLTDGDPDFTLDLSSTSFNISPGGTTTFDVTSQSSVGSQWRNLEINNNDPDETPYNIRLERN